MCPRARGLRGDMERPYGPTWGFGAIRVGMAPVGSCSRRSDVLVANVDLSRERSGLAGDSHRGQCGRPASARYPPSRRAGLGQRGPVTPRGLTCGGRRSRGSRPHHQMPRSRRERRCPHPVSLGAGLSPSSQSSLLSKPHRTAKRMTRTSSRTISQWPQCVIHLIGKIRSDALIAPNTNQ